MANTVADIKAARVGDVTVDLVPGNMAQVSCQFQYTDEAQASTVIATQVETVTVNISHPNVDDWAVDPLMKGAVQARKQALFQQLKADEHAPVIQTKIDALLAQQ